MVLEVCTQISVVLGLVAEVQPFGQGSMVVAQRQSWGTTLWWRSCRWCHPLLTVLQKTFHFSHTKWQILASGPDVWNYSYFLRMCFISLSYEHYLNFYRNNFTGEIINCSLEEACICVKNVPLLERQSLYDECYSFFERYNEDKNYSALNSFSY